MPPSIDRKKSVILSVSITPDLKKSLSKYAKKKEMTTSSVVADMLKSYLLLKEWEEIQSFMGPALLKLGIDSDEAVEEYFK